MAREHRQIFNETFASLALARVLLGSAGLAAAPEIEAALDRAFELVRQTGAKAIEPHVHVELGALARLRGDRGGEQRELRRAHQLFAKIGATGHARRLAVELAVAAW